VLVLQLLTIHLDESDCFAAWRSAKEANLEENIDIKGWLCHMFLTDSCSMKRRPILIISQVMKSTYTSCTLCLSVKLSAANIS